MTDYKKEYKDLGIKYSNNENYDPNKFGRELLKSVPKKESVTYSTNTTPSKENVSNNLVTLK